VAARDARDPALDRRVGKRSAVLVVTIAAFAISAAVFAAVERRPLDHHYTYYLTYGDANGAPYSLLLPLPTDAELRGTWRFLGNGTAAVGESTFGTVLRVTALGNITLSASLDTWRDLPATLTTEGSGPNGRAVARVLLNSSEAAVTPKLLFTFTKADSAWTLTRSGGPDLFEGWSSLEIRDQQERTPSY
jgi:hypothetical protein